MVPSPRIPDCVCTLAIARYRRLRLTLALIQSIVIRLGTGPAARLGCISSVVGFSSSLSTLRFAMYGFSPLLKLEAHIIALMIVITMRTMVMTAKVVSDFLAGK